MTIFNKSTEQKEYVTEQQALQILHVQFSYLKKLIEDGKLGKPLKNNDGVLVLKEEVLAYKQKMKKRLNPVGAK